ncbi:hypothetical protein [Methylobacillus glycogenes]|uniref:hypothetical protein n=1 Tax=Methylobacillus glycogenes TaxID=406 RepID=UPI000471CD15|nr:hypothetical protein [Methylobacillus glycogenes]
MEITDKDKVKTYETTMPLLLAMFGEFKELSKKTPTSAISKQKITIVNRLLNKILEALENEDTKNYLDLLDEDDIPQLSDVALILSQYVAAMQAFKQKYHGWDGNNHRWFTK